ncbi:MAG: hypothetical protein JXA89_06665 [Anaerolineae bacterium]|nr:hypothetical protein [Anaerolineae bacterium]
MNKTGAMRLASWPICVLVAMLILAGCSPGKESTIEPTQAPPRVEPQVLPTTTPTLPPQHAVSPLPSPEAQHNISPLPPPEQPGSETAIEIPAQAADAVAWAQADMAGQLGILQEQIILISVEAVQWRDTSLGCPQPGMMYAQVITPGYRIVLQGGKERYEYHSAQDRVQATLCDPGQKAVLVYQRSGGFAGLSEQWEVFADGRIVTDDGRQAQVPVEKVTALLQMVEELGFFTMTGNYMPRDTCCDRFTYVLTIRNGDQKNTVQTIDAAPNTPNALWDILDAVNQFITDAD